MAKVTFKSNILRQKTLRRPIDTATGFAIGNAVIKEIKTFVSKGLSPVKSLGRFIGYKAQISPANEGRKRGTSAPKKGYPYNIQKKFPDKKVRPVNLKLTGKMLAALKMKFEFGKQKIQVGIFDQEESKKAETHNRGTQVSRGIPTRRFIPQGEEQFNESIRKTMVDLATKRILDIIRRNK